MWLIRFALRRPITVAIAVIGMALCAALAVRRMRIDIFPDLNLPVIYVAQPYGGMSPAQMEGYLVYYYEYHFLYINGIESVEDKSIQGNGLLKLTFHPGTDMSEALAQTISYVNRARAFMPPGTISPFVIRFDAGTVPVGYLVFSSETRSVNEIQDLALNRVRPAFATLPGLTSPPPFGGNQRTIVVTVNPERLRAYKMSPDEVVQSVNSGNVLMPAGNVRTGTLLRIAETDSVAPNIQRLADLPIRTATGPTVFLRDVASVRDASDIPTGYALVNGRRAVYIPVTKRPDASTVDVVKEVKASIPSFQTLVPNDIKISYELDQSSYVKSALNSVIREGLIGAGLTGIVVLLFLGDWRSSLIVMTTIPFALLSAVVALWLSGQTMNIMTLGGLALAVGVLVDEGVVAIENIDSTLFRERGIIPARGVLQATQQTLQARFLSMLAVVAVFVPSFFMTGVAKSLFLPLSLAVGFAMIASFLLSSSLLPVLFLWWHRRKETIGAGEEQRVSRFERFHEWWGGMLRKLFVVRWAAVGIYAGGAIAIILLVGPRLSRELFPSYTGNQFRLRFDAPAGTRAEETEQMVEQILARIGETAGTGNVEISLGYVGTQAASYPINTVFLWTSGPQEAVLNVQLKSSAGIGIQEFEEKLRSRLPAEFPGSAFSFEPGDLVSQIMNFGAPTPIEVAVFGPDFAASRGYAAQVRNEMSKISELRDLKYEEPLDYPSVDVKVDREMAGQMGVTTSQVARSISEATLSSRFTAPNYWADPRSGIAYQVQVQYPQPAITSPQDVQNIPVMTGAEEHPLVGDLANVQYGTVVGEYDRRNSQRMVGISANVAGDDLNAAAKHIDAAVRRAGTPPRGTTVQLRGQIAPMRETFSGLAIGLLIAVITIFLLLAANFQSLRLGLAVLLISPAAICGVILMLLLTGTSLNMESYIGAIMAVGVGTANAILLVTFAEERRTRSVTAEDAAIEGASRRMRPIIMTSAAMIAGMIPMALALGSGAEEAAPLGRAVIGGLLAVTCVNLTVLPLLFGMVQSNAYAGSASLDPDDANSRFADSNRGRDPEAGRP